MSILLFSVIKVFCEFLKSSSICSVFRKMCIMQFIYLAIVILGIKPQRIKTYVKSLRNVKNTNSLLRWQQKIINLFIL